MRLSQTKEQLLITGNRYVDLFKHAIKAHIDNFLERFTDDKILRISFERRIYDYETNEYICNRTIELVVYRPNNYTAIFSREFDTVPFYNRPAIYKDLLLWCFHDDCWRTDGIDRFFSYYENKITGLRHDGLSKPETLTENGIKEMRATLRQQSSYDGNRERCRIIDEMIRNA